MKTHLLVHQLHQARPSDVVLFSDELVRECSMWTSERLVMTNSSIGTIDRADMYAFLAVFFFSQCSRFSVAKTSELLQKLNCPILPLSLVQYLPANILAFSTTGHRDGGRVSGALKRIKQCAFQSLKWQHTVCLVTSHNFATLYDVLLRDTGS